jgi:hypothetical protein
MRVIGPSDSCGAGEQLVSWVTTGLKGQRGRTGAQGPIGPRGMPGPTGYPGKAAHNYPRLELQQLWTDLNTGGDITPGGLHGAPFTLSYTLPCVHGGIAIAGGGHAFLAPKWARRTSSGGVSGPWQDLALRSSYPVALTPGDISFWSKHTGDDLLYSLLPHLAEKDRERLQRYGFPYGLDGWHVRFALNGVRPLEYPPRSGVAAPLIGAWVWCLHEPGQ